MNKEAERSFSRTHHRTQSWFWVAQPHDFQSILEDHQSQVRHLWWNGMPQKGAYIIITWQAQASRGYKPGESHGEGSTGIYKAPFSRWANWDSEGLNPLPKATPWWSESWQAQVQICLPCTTRRKNDKALGWELSMLTKGLREIFPSKQKAMLVSVWGEALSLTAGGGGGKNGHHPLGKELDNIPKDLVMVQPLNFHFREFNQTKLSELRGRGSGGQG